MLNSSSLNAVDCHDFSESDDLQAIADSYYEGARMAAHKSYQLFSAKHLMAQLAATYKFPDQAISDPKFWSLRDTIAALEAEMS